MKPFFVKRLNVVAGDVEVRGDGLRFLVGDVEVRSRLRALFNVYNCLSAVAGFMAIAISIGR